MKKITFLLPLFFIPTFAVADNTALIERGQTIYNGAGACGSCHGMTGKGDGPAAVALDPKPRDFTTGVYSYDADGDGSKGTKDDIYNILTNGTAKYGGSPLMVGRPDIADEDRKALVEFLLSLKK